MFWRRRYSGFGEELTCSDPYTLRNDSVVTLGDIGSFLAIGPTELDSAYVAFTMNGLTAWLRISFVLGSGIDVVRMQIHEVLTACSTTSIPLSDLAPAPLLFPDPSDGRDLQIAQGTVARSIRISDATGRVVAAYSGPRQTIPCPVTPGVYFISVLSSDERTTVVRLERN